MGSANDETIASTYNDRDQLTLADSSVAGSDTTFEYDANGSLTSEATAGAVKRYVWDLRNRMTGFDANGDNSLDDAGDATFHYDHAGVRVGKTVERGASPDEVTAYLQDTNNPTGYSQVLEARLNGSLARSYIIGSDVIAQADGSTVSYLLYDAGGSTRAIVDATGQVATGQLFAYDAYGNRLDPANPVVPATNLLYRGEYFDATLGQYVLRARYYTPGTGQMLSRDPRGEVLGDTLNANLYAYGSNNPIYYTDPSGKFSTTEIMVTTGIIGAVVGASVGTYIGYRKTGTLFSKETLGYAIIGAGAGFAIGLMIGGAVGPLVGGGMPTGALGSVAKISSKLVQTVARGKFMKVTPLTFTAGVIAGVATEVTTPDAFDTWITPVSLLALPGNSLGLIVYRSFVTRRVPGPIQETLAFVAGFNVGYFGAKNLPDLPNTLRQIPELAGDVFDAVTGN